MFIFAPGPEKRNNSTRPPVSLIKVHRKLIRDGQSYLFKNLHSDIFIDFFFVFLSCPPFLSLYLCVHIILLISYLLKDTESKKKEMEDKTDRNGGQIETYKDKKETEAELTIRFSFQMYLHAPNPSIFSLSVEDIPKIGNIFTLLNIGLCRTQTKVGPEKKFFQGE